MRSIKASSRRSAAPDDWEFEQINFVADNRGTESVIESDRDFYAKLKKLSVQEGKEYKLLRLAYQPSKYLKIPVHSITGGERNKHILSNIFPRSICVFYSSSRILVFDVGKT